eukprot:103801-Rhodomonas_salina.1
MALLSGYDGLWAFVSSSGCPVVPKCTGTSTSLLLELLARSTFQYRKPYNLYQGRGLFALESDPLSPFAVSGTDLAYDAICLRACYAMSGTGLASSACNAYLAQKSACEPQCLCKDAGYQRTASTYMHSCSRLCAYAYRYTHHSTQGRVPLAPMLVLIPSFAATRISGSGRQRRLKKALP